MCIYTSITYSRTPVVPVTRKEYIILSEWSVFVYFVRLRLLCCYLAWYTFLQSLFNRSRLRIHIRCIQDCCRYVWFPFLLLCFPSFTFILPVCSHFRYKFLFRSALCNDDVSIQCWQCDLFLLHSFSFALSISPTPSLPVNNAWNIRKRVCDMADIKIRIYTSLFGSSRSGGVLAAAVHMRARWLTQERSGGCERERKRVIQ